MKANNSIENPEWALIGRYLTGEATAAEVKEVETWVAASEKNRQELEQAKQLLENADAMYTISKFDTEKAWAKVRKQTITSVPVYTLAASRKKAIASYYKYAAAILLAVLIGSAAYLLVSNNAGTQKYTEVVTSHNQVINEYVLPDGSTVTLNSNSSLQFPEKFTGNTREVTITGEAFFDVEPDPQKPFVIYAGNARVKVLGTSFNVNAYPGAESVEVTVETGIVQVLCCEGEEPDNGINLLLNAGERGTLKNTNRKLEKTINSDPNYLAWKTHNLVFEKTPLKEVALTLEKVYHTRIELKDAELENLLLTAQFENKTAEFILDVICLTFNLELTQQNGTFMLSKKTMSNN